MMKTRLPACGAAREAGYRECGLLEAVSRHGMATIPLEGGCFCGELRYRAQSVFDAGYCHCSICRRFTGCAALTWFSVPESEFSLLQGSPKTYRSSQNFYRHFCRSCGTHLFGTAIGAPPPNPGFKLVSVGIGTLDEPDRVKPRVHQWWSSRVCWFADHERLPHFDDGRLTHPSARPAGET